MPNPQPRLALARGRRHRARTVDPNPVWPREKMLALLGLIGLAAVLVVVGLGFAISHALRPAPATSQPDGGASPAAATSQPAVLPATSPIRDQAAASPMPTVPTGAAGSLPAAAGSATMRLPLPQLLRGPGGLASGFEHTPEGAVAQLAAIDEFVLTAMQPQIARDTHQAWALPGGTTAEQWLMTQNVESYTATLSRAGIPAAAGSVQARPVAGQVKAADGSDWVVACVLLDVRATVKTQAQLGYGHCERMQWADGRWQIGPGTPPAQPEPVSPGSEAAADAGWRTFTN
mgnify:CR=1 FL=1